jgi:uracil permease
VALFFLYHFEKKENAMATKSNKPKKAAPAKTKAKSQPVVQKQVEVTQAAPSQVIGYLPDDTPPVGAMLSLGFQQFLTMFPATVLVAVLTKFDVGITLLASGLGTIVALLVSKRKIPMYYGSSFSYIAVIITVMSKFAPDCYNSTAAYCPEGVRIVQVGIILTAVFEILVGLLIMRIGKAALDRVLPPIVTGSMAMVIGVALANAALGNAGNWAKPEVGGISWTVAFITLIATI